MNVTSDGHIVSSGRGFTGLLVAWHGLARVFTSELPRLIRSLGRIAQG